MTQVESPVFRRRWSRAISGFLFPQRGYRLRIAPRRRSSRRGLVVASVVALVVAPSIATSTAVAASLEGPNRYETSSRVAGAASPRCAPSLANRLASTSRAAQLITVESPDYASTYATISAWRRHGSCWHRVFGPWNARIGANGFSDHKVEGDDTTPTGAYGIGPVMYGNAANPGVRYGYRRLVCGDWWDETPGSPQYNRFQHVPCGEDPGFGGGSEALWEEARAYPSFAVIDYNTSPVVAGAGSAIFLHATLGYATEGCVSLPLTELDDLLRWLVPAARPIVVMGPATEIERF
ncbi:MAG: L,D-transpeptidase family protein [Acidimicrobiales bacterium]